MRHSSLSQILSKFKSLKTYSVCLKAHTLQTKAFYHCSNACEIPRRSVTIVNRFQNNVTCTQVRCKSLKSYLDYSQLPKLNEDDLDEQFVRGSGPGGQATNKTNNAVVLKHKPTGLVIKCHETRSLWENKKRAREILVIKLDNLLNGEGSIENQERVYKAKQSTEKNRKKKKLLELKTAFKEREGLT